jgi:RNA polymerase sigma-70 factor (ECF subfamily)
VPDFQQLFEEQVAGVWRLLRGMGLDQAQVEDCSQEVFLIVHQQLPKFEGRSKLSTWIYSIAYRVGAKHRKKSVPRSSEPDWETFDLTKGGSPERELEDRELGRMVYDYYARLNEGMRDAFLLCLIEGRTARETAEILDISINTVSSRVRIIRAALRELLESRNKVKAPWMSRFSG